MKIGITFLNFGWFGYQKTGFNGYFDEHAFYFGLFGIFVDVWHIPKNRPNKQPKLSNNTNDCESHQ